MAKDILKRGMWNGKDDAEIDALIQKVSASDGYKSHGAVIDFTEARQLGLAVEYLSRDDDLWKRIWLRYCMYDYDTKAKNIGKVFEGAKFSIARQK